MRYSLPRSGKTAMRYNYRSGMTEIHVEPACEARGLIRRTAAGNPWRVLSGDSERMVTMVLARAVACLDIIEKHAD